MSDGLIMLSNEARAEYNKLNQLELNGQMDDAQAHRVNKLLQWCINWGYVPDWKEDFESMYEKYQ